MYPRYLWQKCDSVCDEDPGLAGERARRTDHLLEDVLPHVRVHRRELQRQKG